MFNTILGFGLFSIIIIIWLVGYFQQEERINFQKNYKISQVKLYIKDKCDVELTHEEAKEISPIFNIYYKEEKHLCRLQEIKKFPEGAKKIILLDFFYKLPETPNDYYINRQKFWDNFEVVRYDS